MLLTHFSLYKEDPRNKLSISNRAEFYLIRVSSERDDGRTVFELSEKHGWWDEENKAAVDLRETILPEEPLEKKSEAMQWAKNQVVHRVREGFIYSASFDPFSEDHLTVEVLRASDVEAYF